MFEALAPSIGRKLIQKTLPLKFRDGFGNMHGLRGMLPYTKLIIIGGILSLVGVFCLGPMVGRMNDVKDAMCSGDTNFIAFQLIRGPVVVGVPVATGVDSNNYRSRAILQRAGLLPNPDPNRPLYYEGKPYAFKDALQQVDVFQTRRWASQTFADMASVAVSERDGFACIEDALADSYPNTQAATWASLRDMTNNNSVRTSHCGDLEDYCWQDTNAGRATRINCPITCGVSDPLSGQAFQRLQDGAVLECRNGLQSNLAIPASRKISTPQPCISAVTQSACSQIGCVWFGTICQEQCYEPTPAQLQAMPGWGHYITTLTAGMLGTFYHCSLGNATYMDELRDGIANGLRSEGCPFVKKIAVFCRSLDANFPLDICDPAGHLQLRFGGIRSARYFCPVTCGCQTFARPVLTSANWTPQLGSSTECWERCFT